MNTLLFLKYKFHEVILYTHNILNLVAKSNADAKLKIAVLEFNTNNIAITSSPIYYSNYDDKVILPSNMEIVYPSAKVY